MTSSWLVYALGSAIFAGLTALLAKIGVQGLSSNLATFIRTLVILALSALFVSFDPGWRHPQISSRAFTFLILSGIATGLSWLCYYRALQLGPVAKVAPIDKLSVVFAVIFAVTFLGEKPTGQIWIGIGLIAVGALVVAF